MKRAQVKDMVRLQAAIDAAKVAEKREAVRKAAKALEEAMRG